MKLRKIYTAHVPRKGFTAMTIWPFVFVRSDRKRYFTKKAERHEATHGKQQIEVGVIGVVLAASFLLAGCGWWSLLPLPIFLWIYLVEWLIKIPFCRFDVYRAYLSVSFEQEAYDHQDEVGYNNVRKHYSWFRYLFTITPDKK